jgi:CubicO group peptidase (beta-lactamase class C family)
VLDSTFLRACEDAAARFDVPALALGIAGPDGTTELHALGCELDTRFRVASVTKPMTATLALGLLDVDDPTGVWPEDVRVRHLLAHLSGFDCELPGDAAFGDGDDALAAAVAELPGVPRLVGVDTAWSYGNTGYWLAGRLAADAAGCSYEDALRRHVLSAAGMASSSFEDPDLPGTGRGAHDEPYPRYRRPSGGLVADVADVVRFGRWQLSEPWTDALRRPLAKPVSGVYGLGFFGERVAGVEVWGHPGSAFGYQASFLLVPDRGAVFAGLTNSGSGAQALAELEELWLQRLLGAGRSRAEPVQLPAAVLASFAGTYANAQTTVTVTVEGDGVVAEVVDGTGTVTLTARPIGPRRCEVVGGDFARARFDFPLYGFARVGSVLLPRVA